MSNRVFQEFYCAECNGYILVKLNMAINGTVKVVCPNCKHEHFRQIQKGEIIGDAERESNQELCPPKSAYSKISITHRMKEIRYPRKSAPIKNKKDLDIGAKNALNSLWFELYGMK